MFAPVKRKSTKEEDLDDEDINEYNNAPNFINDNRMGLGAIDEEEKQKEDSNPSKDSSGLRLNESSNSERNSGSHKHQDQFFGAKSMMHLPNAFPHQQPDFARVGSVMIPPISAFMGEAHKPLVH